MRTLLAVLVALAFVLSPALAGDPPYAKLASELGTPQLADSAGPADKSQLSLTFVPNGESAHAWTKLTSVSIVKVDEAQMVRETTGVIASLHDRLVKEHAHVDTFEIRSASPVSCYFAYRLGSERDRGIAYSPAPGFVTIAQVAEKTRTTITSDDVKTLKAIVGR